MPLRIRNRKLSVAILVTDGFEQSELEDPRAALDDAGASTVLVAPRAGTVKAWDVSNWGDEFSVDLTLDSATADDFDALLLPGGVQNPDDLRMNDKAIAFIRAFIDADKPVAAICHGPWTLIEADAVRGRRLTSYPSLRTDLINAGAQWVDEEVVVDHKLITSRNPHDLPAFIEAMIEVLGQVEDHHPTIVGSSHATSSL